MRQKETSYSSLNVLELQTQLGKISQIERCCSVPYNSAAHFDIHSGYITTREVFRTLTNV